MASFSDFQKLEFRVGEIQSASKVEDTDRLLKLQVKIGEEKRQLVAGIAEQYSADEIGGKQVCVLVNLEPKEIKGVESQGMILAADSDEGPVLVEPEKKVESGISVY